ncbi:hypothetical protein [Devosia beringensis]|uniref:hypothetical protein n=1 Tax=Devosia beringensis TaxID=2657486 RepID=UPI00186B99BF|nr:hypothetical protein [Devosia beringensis]
MRIAMTGQQTALGAAWRAGSVALTIVLGLALAACTTVEGTNALTDVGTFEREVMSSTAHGIGLIPGEAPKEDLTHARAPLVLPASGQALPAPTTTVVAAQLPKDSDSVQIDASNLTDADIQRLRNARVVDLRSVAGRPLTEEEARALTARMRAANRDVRVDNSSRPLYMPPDEYFTRVGNAELICSTPGGELVSINDPKCPADVRNALRRGSGEVISSPMTSVGVGLSEKETTLD